LKTKSRLPKTVTKPDSEAELLKVSKNGLMAFFTGNSDYGKLFGFIEVSRRLVHTDKLAVAELATRAKDQLYAHGLLINDKVGNIGPSDILQAFLSRRNEFAVNQFDRMDLSTIVADYCYRRSRTGKSLQLYASVNSPVWDEHEQLDSKVFCAADGLGWVGESEQNGWRSFGPLGDLIVAFDNNDNAYQTLCADRDLPLTLNAISTVEWALLAYDMEDYKEIQKWLQLDKSGRPIRISTTGREGFLEPSYVIEMSG